MPIDIDAWQCDAFNIIDRDVNQNFFPHWKYV
jgi:hypothetical protein